MGKTYETNLPEGYREILSVDAENPKTILWMSIAGCAGDLYDTFLFFTKLKDPAILMKDTGPKQTFYQK